LRNFDVLMPSASKMTSKRESAAVSDITNVLSLI
jgi:hypothetical protein